MFPVLFGFKVLILYFQRYLSVSFLFLGGPDEPILSYEAVTQEKSNFYFVIVCHFLISIFIM